MLVTLANFSSLGDFRILQVSTKVMNNHRLPHIRISALCIHLLRFAVNLLTYELVEYATGVRETSAKYQNENYAPIVAK